MNRRVHFARLLLRLGNFIQSLPVALMKPDDLIEFSHQTYSRSSNVEAWSEDPLLNSGLSDSEQELIGEVAEIRGDLLLLGVGGGREAIPLANMGFRVTGVDYVPAMVDRALENAANRGLQIKGLVQEISRLDVNENAYDVVWLSRAMYSCVPTRSRRVAMVKRIKSALKPGGFFLCQFQCRSDLRIRGKSELLKRAFAASILGNRSYEEGDKLWLNVEFVHEFSSEETIRSEIEEGGLPVLRIRTYPSLLRGSVVCRKNL